MLFECENLSFSYGSLPCLRDISFSSSGSTTIGILGRNGSGKSTLLKIISGWLPMGDGDIRIQGLQAVTPQGRLRGDLRRQVGILFQSSSSDDKLSCRMNLWYAARLMGMERKEAKLCVEETLGLANLRDYAEAPVKKLSGGMRRRLELYRTFMHKPKVLLLDEPSAFLDVKERQKFFSFLDDYKIKHKALILKASHQDDELLNADRVIFLQQGSIKLDDDPKRILSNVNYVCCSLRINSNKFEPILKEYGLFDLQADPFNNIFHAKIKKTDLSTFLKCSLLIDGVIQGFTVDAPTLIDACESKLMPKGGKCEHY